MGQYRASRARRARSSLCEREALNLLQRLSEVATLTAPCVEAVAGTGAVILDTRKTTSWTTRIASGWL